MSDIVERLRNPWVRTIGESETLSPINADIMKEAADEIERLRAKCQKLQQRIRWIADELPLTMDSNEIPLDLEED